MRLLKIWITSLLFLAGCSSEKSFLYEIDNSWYYKDTYKNTVLANKDTVFRLSIKTRYTPTYQYKNLHLKIIINENKIIEKNLYLFDNYGKPIGKRFFSDYGFTLKTNEIVKLNSNKINVIEIKHMMKNDTIFGIKSIDLVLTKQ